MHNFLGCFAARFVHTIRNTEPEGNILKFYLSLRRLGSKKFRTRIWAITVAVQYTKIMYRPNVCPVKMYVPSQCMYRPNVCTIRAYVPSGRIYHPDVCTVPTYVPSRRMYRPGVWRLSGCNRLARQVVQVDCTGSPLLRLDCPS